MPRHQFQNRKASLAHWNKLNPKIIHTATYYDGAILQPERLALQLILDAETDNPNPRRSELYEVLVGGNHDTLLLRDELTDTVYDVKPSGD